MAVVIDKLEWVQLRDNLWRDREERYRIVHVFGRYMLVHTRRDGEVLGEATTLAGAKRMATVHSKKPLLR